MTRDAVARAAGPAITALAAGVLLLTACGGPRRPSLTAQAATADALVTVGCYRCLDEAVARYFALPPAQGAAAAANDTTLFRTLILLAMREKELGLDAAAHLKQAGLLVLHVTNPVVAREQLRWAELIPANPSGLPRDVSETQHNQLTAARSEVDARLARAAADRNRVDTYIDVSLACALAYDLRPLDPAAIAGPAIADPLIQWRVVTCDRRQDDALRTFAGGHPRYVESEYVIGRHLIALVGDPKSRREARDRLRTADREIPGSPAIAVDLAGVTRVTSPKDALPLYERVTRAQPRHHEAWLGQAICLTYLDRSREAIAAATTLIDLGRWFTGEAYYWRAWNRHHLGELDAAWADATTARRTLFTTDVFGLAGRIAHDQGQFDSARPLLVQALALSDANCPAWWVLGLVESAQEKWPEGGHAFEGAERCSRAEIDRLRAEQRAADAGDATDAEALAARAAESDAAIRTAEQQAALAAYNAAFDFVKGGDRERARPLLDRAITHPAVADRARELRAFVDR
jgi:tetratricopeptide (TPR) repeat protein